jgi:hypothetical protein
VSEPAGKINDQGSDNDAEFRAVLEAYPDEVRTLAFAVRDLIYDVLPQTVEVVWPRQRSIGWGTGPKKFTEQFAYLQPFKKHVSLGFYHGGELPDPDGLLPKSGGTQVSGTLSMRSVQIRSLDDVRRPALRALIEAATKVGVPPPGR